MNEEPEKDKKIKENMDTVNEIEGIKKEEKKQISLKVVIIIVLSISALICVICFAHSLIEKKRFEESFNFYHDPTPSNEPHLVVDKPIIYLYPQEETNIVVKLGNPEKLTSTYPKYKETGWKVTAYPDGKLMDNETGRSLYSLYWEGLDTEDVNFNEGFCVKGEDTIKFLEEKLAILGLTEKEAEEFIVYWLPKMEDNKYNLIRFASEEEINENMPLEFSVKPDTIIRVLMQFKALDEYENIQEQKLITPERAGFVVVEWGGSITN